ncbi:MAG: glycosyltransferase family 2 protein [Bacteroidia bacterium]
MNWPKITIVTPSFNQGSYLEQTILSVLGQNYPNLEYFIMDGGSTDNSVDIIKKYEKQLAGWVSEKDKGVYDAVQKGFARSNGELMAWINSDDMYHPKSLFTVAELFETLKDVRWIQGMPTSYDESGRTIASGPLRLWSKYNFYTGDFEFIQQESVFWRRSLWEAAGSTFNTRLKYAADMELWTRFFRHDKLYVTNALIGGFRFRQSNQLSSDNYPAYMSEAKTCLEKEELDGETRKRIAEIQNTKKLLGRTRYFQIGRLKLKYYNLFEYPPRIMFSRASQKFEKKDWVDFNLIKL